MAEIETDMDKIEESRRLRREQEERDRTEVYKARDFVLEQDAISAAAQLKADLKKAKPFRNGTVVRWTSVAVNGSRFVYAAVFAEGFWFTTAASDNRHVQKRMSHEDFLAYFNTHGYGVTDLGVATAFEAVEL